MTLILSGTNGVSDIDGDASTPALRGTDANSGVFFGSDVVGVSTGGSEKVSVGASALVINDGGADFDFRVEGDTNANLLFVDASTDRVGVGTNAPDGKLHVLTSDASVTPNADADELVVENNGAAGITIASSASSVGSIRFADSGSDRAGMVYYSHISDFMRFDTAATERMRIDSSGNLLVAKTAANAATAGVQIESTGTTVIGRDNAVCLILNRLTADGDIISLRKSGTEVGTIGTASSYLYIHAPVASGGAGLGFGNSWVYPCDSTGSVEDNTTDLGVAAVGRFNDAYITNGVTTGSDRNDKQDIEELTEAETRVAVAAKALLRKWRWKDAVAKKGDNARIHFGIIAQDLKAAFEDEGLDAHRYGMFMWNEWWEKERIIPAVEAQEAVYETQTDEEGNETQVLVSEAVEAQPERTVTDTFETEEAGAVRKERMGIRYNELLAFIIAAI